MMRFNSPADMLDALGKQDFIRNNPTKQQYFNVLMNAFRTGDTSEAEQLAANIHQGYGKTRDGMMQLIRRRLGFPN